jgi:hypothetical protein
MAILNLKGVPFHPVVFVGLGYDFLFKSLLAHCEHVLYNVGASKQDVTFRNFTVF